MLGSKPQPRLRTSLEESQIREQLEKIVSSATFARSDRMSGFLRYIVEQTLKGNGHTLKEPVIAQDCFDQGHDFDGAANPIVRVEARRLRDKLREYYEGAEGDPVLIKLPKGSYVPSFERNGGTMPAVVLPLPRPEPVAPAPQRRYRRRIVWLASAPRSSLSPASLCGTCSDQILRRWYGCVTSLMSPATSFHQAFHRMEIS